MGNLTINEAISSSQGNNMTTLTSGIWQRQQEPRIISNNQGDRVVIITMEEGMQAMVGAPRYPKATKVYLSLTMPLSKCKVMLLLSLNRLTLK